MALLEVRDISKRFGGLVALSGVSFAAESGKIFGIIGPNGAGKTTMFNVITGLEQPESGSILLGGEEITGMALNAIARKGLARTFQRSMPFGSMTALDNVLVAGHAFEPSGLGKIPRRWLGIGDGGGALTERALELLEFTGLPNRAEDLAETLSHGDQRRLEIARALMTRPRVLMLDEPAAGLSPAELTQFIDLLRRLRSTGGTVVLIEHNMSLIMSLCDRIAVLDHGVKIAEGTPAEIQKDSAVLTAYLGSKSQRA